MGVHWGGFFSVRLTLGRSWEREARYIWRGSCLIMFVIILIHPPLLTAHDLMNVWSLRLPPRVVRLTAPMPGVSGCRCTLVIALEYAIQNPMGNLLPGHHGPWRKVGTIHPTNESCRPPHSWKAEASAGSWHRISLRSTEPGN